MTAKIKKWKRHALSTQNDLALNCILDGRTDDEQRNSSRLAAADATNNMDYGSSYTSQIFIKKIPMDKILCNIYTF